MLPTLKLKLSSLSISVLGISLLPLLTAAQTDPSAAQKSIEQSTRQLRQRMQPKPLVLVDVLGLETSAAIGKLVSVKVKGELFSKAIETYWQPHSGQSISVEELQAFHAWFYNKASHEGLMAYARSSVTEIDGGQQLNIDILQPKVNAVRILANDPGLAPGTVQRIRERFAESFKPAMPLDTLWLDQRLDSASHDLPVELDATLRAVGPELMDVLITLSPSRLQSGQVSSGIVQANNYGLKQFGQAQVLGAVTVGTPSPKSQLSLIGQASQGILYARAEYEDLASWAGGRWRLFGSRSNSHNITGGAASTEGLAFEVGSGLTHVLGGSRDVVYKLQTDLAQRETDNRLRATGAPISNIQDRQLRLRWTADNERLSARPLRAELGLTQGQYTQVIGSPLSTGHYTRIDGLLSQQFSLNDTNSWSLSTRIRGQWVNRNLDGYNQLAIGGVNGVRAYTSTDGVGDRGIVGSVELTRTIGASSSASAFYDAGQIQAQVSPFTTTSVNRYNLQAFGIQLQGRFSQWHYSLIAAKGVGGYKAWLPTNTESEPNNNRLTLAVTYSY